MAQSPFVSSQKTRLSIQVPLHGERQILSIAHIPLTPTNFPFLPYCIPVWARPSLPLLPSLQRERIYILIGRAAHHLRMKGMCSGKQQETHPAASFQWTLQIISAPEKMIFLATGPPCLQLMATYCMHNHTAYTHTHVYLLNKLDHHWNEISYCASLD